MESSAPLLCALNFISLTSQMAEDPGGFPEHPCPGCSTPRSLPAIMAQISLVSPGLFRKQLLELKTNLSGVFQR